MNASKMFRSLVLGGASLALSACGPATNNTTDSGVDAGPMDAGNMDAGPMDAGNCVCNPDPSWPGNDCGVLGAPAVCCWLQPNATCCPG